MAKGEYSREKFMKEVKELASSLVSSRKDSIKISVPEAKVIDNCPKCKKNLMLKSYQSNHYVQCENSDCKLSYSTDAKGEPLGGRCNKNDCNGAVNITKSGSKICVVCSSWQNEAKKALGDCPKCKAELQHKSYQGRHYALCSNGDCKLSYDIKDDGKPVGGTCKKCKGAMKVTKSKDKICVSCGAWAEKKQTKAKTVGRLNV